MQPQQQNKQQQEEEEEKGLAKKDKEVKNTTGFVRIQQLAGASQPVGGSGPGTGGMFCYHCPSGLPAPRLPPSLEYPFAPTHPCKYTWI